MPSHRNVVLLRQARVKPLAICVKGQNGHIVGIPPLLRKFRDPIFDLLPESVSVAVEIGTLQGWFAWRCMKYLPDGSTLFCVDPFGDSEGAPGDYNQRCWKKNLKKEFGKRVFLLKKTSEQAASEWGSAYIDFLFIDGDHHRDIVYTDLSSWVPKVRQGGLVAGHDIDGRWGEEVQWAVEKYCSENEIRSVHVHTEGYSYTGVQSTPIWWFLKP